MPPPTPLCHDSRTTPDGSVLLFESRADLAGFDSDGKAQIYRFDAPNPSLECLSCNPTGASPVSDASLQTLAGNSSDFKPTGRFAFVSNLATDGRRAFFQTPDALVLTDTDGFQDVYEWEAQGVGSCQTEGGCTYLISSGQSSRDDYLYGASEDGDDVFVWTSDLLLGRDAEEAPSIYDARVGGGFAEPQEDCVGQCRHTTPPPSFSVPASPAASRSGNVEQVPKRCSKGKRRVKRHGRYVCIRRHRKHHHRRHRSHTSGRAVR